ncbi:unnamed protein product, partial [Mesorhabditis spiculigera]
MSEIDLGDRRGLIALAYGTPGDPINSTNASNSTLDNSAKRPLTKETPKNTEPKQPKKSKRIACAPATCCFLLICAILGCLLSALVAYGLTKQAFDNHGSVLPFVPDPRYNLTRPENAADYEDDGEEENIIGPTLDEMRLPKAIMPIWYNLTVKVYLPGFVPLTKENNLTYDASVTIKIKAIEETDKIVLNAKGLDLDLSPGNFRVMEDRQRAKRVPRETTNSTLTEGFNATEIEQKDTLSTTTERSNQIPEVNGPVESKTKATKISFNETLELLTIKLGEKLPVGKELYLKFALTAKIRPLMSGLYYSTYKLQNGTERIIAMTQMQPASARKFVPCFDEPQFKTPWKVKIIHPKGSNAISNGIEEEEAVGVPDSSDWVYSTFRETPPLASYLLALSVNDFDYIEGKSESGVRLRIWSRPSAINQTQYALEIATKALGYYEKYYDIPFPMQKQDMIAVPAFDAGAMENMGLIAYRESVLLYDPRTYRLTNKQRVATTICHELAHQWFGDLVTISSWNDIWLNEGFATFLEYKALEYATGGALDIATAFDLRERARAFMKDSKSSSHPLFYNLTTYDEVHGAFDYISYSKGAAFLKMLEGVLGEQAFQKALQNYLKRHLNGNANSTDLFLELNDAVPKDLLGWDGKRLDVVDFAAKWTQQMGYPVVEITRLDNATVEITQRRFKENSLTHESSRYRNARFWYKWDVPLWIMIDGEMQPLQWLHEAYRLNVTEDKLVIVNPESTGYYRVNYDQRGWEAIQRQLEADHTKIPTSARHRLIDDAFTLAGANQLPYETAFNITSYLSNEEETLPWIVAIQGFRDVLMNFDYQPDSEGIQKFALQRHEPLFNKIDLSAVDYTEDKDFAKSILTSTAFESYCALNAPACIEKAKEFFQKNLLESCAADNATASECSTVPVHIRDSVYCYGLQNGSPEAFEKMKNLTMAETESVERVRLLGALGCTNSPYLLRKIIHDALNGSIKVVDTDLPSIMTTASLQPVGRLVLTNMMMDNWRELYEKFKDSQFLIRDLVLYGTRAVNEREKRELEYFLQKYPGSTKRISPWRDLVEKAKTAMEWSRNHRKHLVEYFAKQNAAKTEL